MYSTVQYTQECSVDQVWGAHQRPNAAIAYQSFKNHYYIKSDVLEKIVNKI